MAVSPVQITRISQNFSADFVQDSLRRTQRDLFESQARIASGRRFVTASEAPISAARELDLTRARAQQEQFVSNLQQGGNFLSAGESALVELNDLLIQARSIAVQSVDNLSSADERIAEAEVVASIRQQVLSVANRTLLGRYLFGGRDTTAKPFVDALGGVAFVGDTGTLSIRADDAGTAPISVPGNELFGALSSSLSTNVDLTPKLSGSTRLDAIAGLDRTLLEGSTLIFNEAAGAGAFSVNLDNADTLDDVVALINDAAQQAGAQITASVGATGLEIAPGAFAVSVSDNVFGSAARALGIATDVPATGLIVGQPLRPLVTRLTPVAALVAGAGIDLESGLIISNGINSVTVDLSEAQTVQDILNTINNAGVFVLARINDARTGIDVFNRVSGTSLTIGENGGTTAADLGIRTLDAATPLAQLNGGRGVSIKEGVDDLRITAKDGTALDVNLDGALSIGDVIDLINAAATENGSSITAALATTGNGIQLTDSSAGTGTLSVGILNLSTAALDLGLTEAVPDANGDVTGSDVNPARTEGLIEGLMQLERALRENESQGITLAGGRLDTVRNDIIRTQGVLGARSASVQSRLTQMGDAAATTERFLSEIRDLDFGQAVTRMQSALTQIQASMRSSSTLLNLSLFNFLR